MVRAYIAALILLSGLVSGVANSNDEALKPTWSQLSDDQRKVLAPLSAEWDTLRPWQREKMLDIARDYPKMKPEQQERVQKRLNLAMSKGNSASRSLKL